ncbi:MAG TPA: hypothetical protein DD835_01755 [Halomonas sp.]|nr:hypothetical protein [Halomonas sp.]HBQ07796.1 hypothetical protein [Halomonas sp.]HBS16575.1 hypothetical protein [Halomonas sp.]
MAKGFGYPAWGASPPARRCGMRALMKHR